MDTRVSSAPETQKSRVGSIHFLPVETDNPEQPESAIRLGANKAALIERLWPDSAAAGSLGCLMQIEIHLRRRDSRLPVLHTVELLDRADESA